MIGVYDSGIGGLSVWKELVALMPEQDYVYVADSSHCPYGSKSPDFIVARACAVTDFLMGKNAEAVVVACNTATAAAISYLRSHYPVPFVGMEPAVKPAVQASRTGVVGVLATANTFKGSLYHDTVLRYASGVRIIEKVGLGLVEAVERGEVPSELIRRYVGEMTEEGADVIVLGCTHFPFLQPEIEAAAGQAVRIINPAPAVALQTRRIVRGTSPCRVLPIRDFYSTGDITVLRRTVLDMDPSLDAEHFHPINI